MGLASHICPNGHRPQAAHVRIDRLGNTGRFWRGGLRAGQTLHPPDGRWMDNINGTEDRSVPRFGLNPIAFKLER